MELKKFGSLYIGGQLEPTNHKYRNGLVSIGDTVEKGLISDRDANTVLGWYKVGNRYVLSEVICFGILWTDLDKLGYIFGTTITIDGNPYLCRSLKGASEDGKPNEWTDILDKTTHDPTVWNSDEHYFWCQTSSQKDNALKVVHGGRKPSNCCLWGKDNTLSIIGFRPVLEPLLPDTELTKDLIGHQVTLAMPGTAVTGTLVDYSDYDVFLVPDNEEVEVGRYGCFNDGLLSIDRRVIEYCGGKI